MPVAHCGMYGSQALHLRQYRCQPAALVYEAAKFGKPGSLALHARLPRNIFHHRLRRSREHFEADRRYAVAEIFQRQILEHGIGAAAIGRTSRTDAGSHQRIGQLVGMAVMNAQHPSGLEVACRTAQQIAIRPDTAHAVDRPARQRHGERYGIGVTRRCRPALAAPAGFAPFAQVARPDNRAGHADPAVQRGDGAAIARRAHRQLLQPRAFAAWRTDDARIETAAQRRTDGAAQRAAHQRPEGAEN